MTKYSVPDEHWENEDHAEDEERPTSIESHEIDVILTTDPTEDMGYGREKYTAHIVHKGSPEILYITQHRWKGNYWREWKDWDSQDVSQLVKEQVADALGYQFAEDLENDVRVIGEGGMSCYNRADNATESDGDGDE